MRNNDESLPNLVWDLTLAVRALRKEVRRGRRGVEQEPAAADNPPEASAGEIARQNDEREREMEELVTECLDKLEDMDASAGRFVDAWQDGEGWAGEDEMVDLRDDIKKLYEKVREFDYEEQSLAGKREKEVFERGRLEGYQNGYQAGQEDDGTTESAAFRREHKGYNEGYLAGHADGELCGAKEDADVISRVESDRRIESEFERGKYIGYKQGYEAGVRDGKWSGRGEFQIGDGSPMYGPVTSTNNTGAENDG